MMKKYYLHLDHNVSATEPVWPGRHILKLAVLKTLPKSSNIYTPQGQETTELQEKKVTLINNNNNKKVQLFKYSRKVMFVATRYFMQTRQNTKSFHRASAAKMQVILLIWFFQIKSSLLLKGRQKISLSAFNPSSESRFYMQNGNMCAFLK